MHRSLLRRGPELLRARGRAAVTGRATPGQRPTGPDLHVHLSYSLESAPQDGAALSNPLFRLLSAVADGGSIRLAAQLLGVSYRHAWDALKDWEAALGRPLILWSKGRKARLTEHGQRLVWAERSVRLKLEPSIEGLRGDLACALTEAREARYQVLAMSASHDIALSILQKRMAIQATGLYLDMGVHGSAQSLMALNDQRCLVAGFHVPLLCGPAPVFRKALKPLLNPRLHRLIACSSRTQGLIVRQEHAKCLQSLADVSRLGLRFASRQPGSGTRMLIEHLLEGSALPSIERSRFTHHVEHTHVAVALCVAGGIVDAGIGIEAAALQFGLHFVPLVEESYFLACRSSDIDHPAISRLRRLLAGSEWQGILVGLPGYRPVANPGGVLIPDEVLPWWRRTQRERVGPAQTKRISS